MTNRKIRKRAYQLIVKDGMSHQEAFDLMDQEKLTSQPDLANIVSAIATKAKMEKYKTLKIMFLVGLLLNCLLRIASALLVLDDLNTAVVFLLALMVLVAPGIGIYGVIKYKTDMMQSSGLLLGLGLFRSIRSMSFDGNPLELIIIGIVVATIILAYLLPSKLKTNYKIETVKKKSGENTVSYQVYVFEKPIVTGNSDLLDDFED